MKKGVVVCGYFLKGYPRYENLWSDISEQETVDNRYYEVKGKLATLAYSLSLIGGAKDAEEILVLPGNYLTLIVLCLSRFYHRAVITFDLFVSPYLKKPSRANKLLEWLCCRLPDNLLCVSEKYKEYYSKYGCQPTVVPDRPLPIWFEHPVKKQVNKRKRAVYWGNYLKHHKEKLS